MEIERVLKSEQDRQVVEEREEVDQIKEAAEVEVQIKEEEAEVAVDQTKEAADQIKGELDPEAVLIYHRIIKQEMVKMVMAKAMVKEMERKKTELICHQVKLLKIAKKKNNNSLLKI